MRLLQRLSLMTTLSLTLAGCAHHTEVIVMESPGHHHPLAAGGYQSDVCCLDYHYPYSMLWQGYCYESHWGGHGSHLGGPHFGLGMPRECRSCNHGSCQTACAGGGCPSEAPAVSPALDLEVPPAEPPPAPEAAASPPPRREAPPMTSVLEPLAEQPAIAPPHNKLPESSNRREPSGNVSISIEEPEQDAPTLEEPASETEEAAEVPHNDLPPLRMKLKVSSQRLQSQ